MRLLLISAGLMLATGAGWAASIPATANPVNGWLIAMCAAAGMTMRALYELEARHTAATLLMASGADETTLTAIVGHSKITSTKAYLHTDEVRKLTALENVGHQLGISE